MELTELFDEAFGSGIDRFSGRVLAKKGVSLVDAFWVLLYTNSA